MAGDRGRELREARVEALAAGVDGRVGLRVERIARGEDAAQVVHGAGVAVHRAKIALRDDTRHVLLGRRLDPHGAAMDEQQVVRVGIGDDAAACRQHERLFAADHVLEATALDAPETRLAVQHEDFGQRQRGLALDLAIQLDERIAQLLREGGAERRLAGAAQPRERDVRPARGLVLAEIAHQAKDDVLEPMRWQALEEAPDEPLFDRRFVAARRDR